MTVFIACGFFQLCCCLQARQQLSALKEDLLFFSLFPVISVTLQCSMFILIVAKVLNNDLHVHKSISCEQKPEASDRSEYSVYNRLFFFSTFKTSGRQIMTGFFIWSSAPGTLLYVFTLHTLLHVATC